MVCVSYLGCVVLYLFFFQAEDGIRDLVRSRGLGDVYKRQVRELFGGQPALILLDELSVYLRKFQKKARNLEEALSLIHI